jgi:hypothetical protein
MHYSRRASYVYADIDEYDLGTGALLPVLLDCFSGLPESFEELLS